MRSDGEVVVWSQTTSIWMLPLTAAPAKGGYVTFLDLSFCIHKMEVKITYSP